MSDKDGGQAFPVPAGNFSGGESWGSEDGMSLRDYFAGQALAGLCANGTAVTINGQKFSHEKAAYVLADAMLKERNKER